MSVYIDKAAQISIQQPLSNEWFTNPLSPAGRLCKFVRPDFKQYLSPAVSRRMGTALKCTLSSALACVPEEKRSLLDGILTGTGLGSIENTENFLLAMLEGEDGLSPSNFMQSTHNTLGSQVAIAFNCHGYNITYAHRGTSFDSALMNAVIKFRLNEFKSALVNGVDEMTEKYFQLFDQIGYWKDRDVTIEDVRKATSPGTFAGENSVSLLLTDQPSDQPLCELCDTQLLYRPSDQRLKACVEKMSLEHNVSRIDAVVVGNNGDKENDEEYRRLVQLLAPDATQIIYKHLFGESFTMSGIGVYVGATCLKEKSVPSHITIDNKALENPQTILVLNHFKQLDYSITLLKSC